MGRLLSLLKACGGQIALSGAFGRWAEAISTAAEQGASASAAALDTWSCPSTVSVNDVVYVSGTNTVDKAVDGAPGAQHLPAIGFVVSKPTPTTCLVQYAGTLPNTFAGLVPGTLYYVSATTPGAIVPTGTIFPGGAIVQQVGVAKSTTTLLAQIATI